MNYINGNLIDLAEAGKFDVIVHGCNCFNTMGSGIAKEIKERYPQAYEADLETESGDRMKLGTYTIAIADNDYHAFTIVNAYTQYKFNRSAERADLFEYTAFQLILEKLSAAAVENSHFGFPKLGCDRAGGNEEIIMGLIECFSKEIEKKGCTVTVVKFCPTV